MAAIRCTSWYCVVFHADARRNIRNKSATSDTSSSCQLLTHNNTCAISNRNWPEFLHSTLCRQADWIFTASDHHESGWSVRGTILSDGSLFSETLFSVYHHVDACLLLEDFVCTRSHSSQTCKSRARLRCTLCLHHFIGFQVLFARVKAIAATAFCWHSLLLHFWLYRTVKIIIN